MDLKIIAPDGKETGSITLPQQFSEPVRSDIVRKVHYIMQMSGRAPYGAAPTAGKRASATISKRRRDYKGSYGKGISRTPRKIMSKRGERMNWVGAFAPNTVGGRRAHPPKVEKIWSLKINHQERRKAIRSALAATVHKELVAKRGHQLPVHYPFIAAEQLQEEAKTKAIVTALEHMGFSNELARAEDKKIRAGKGKARGRKYIEKKSILIVVSKACNLLKAGRNIPGVEVAQVQSLNVELLAPGGDLGRITLFTKAAIERLEKEQLFM